MCVAAIIRKPVSLADMMAMERENPDGAGVAWAQEGTLHFQKGMKAKDIHLMQESGWLTYPYLLHFRWATHGTVRPGLAHPFPLGLRALQGETEGTATKLMAHNGTWPEYYKYMKYVDAPDKLIKDASDTAIAAYLMAEWPELAEEIRWAVVTAEIENGEILLTRFGDCWEDHEGNMYSNMNWKKTSIWHDRDWDSWKGYFAARKAAATNWVDPSEISNDIGGVTDSDWHDYMRARYGDQVADQVAKDSCRLPVSSDFADEPTEPDSDLNAWGAGVEAWVAKQNQDLVSDDPQEVNEWIETWANPRSMVG